MPTSIEAQKMIATSLKEKVCSWLGWDELQYCTFQYESGLLYLQHYITHDQWGQDMLQRSKYFWNWWKAQWTSRDASFCDTESGSQPPLSRGNLVIVYRHLHDPVALASEIYPNRVVLDESYNQMIVEYLKQEVHA